MRKRTALIIFGLVLLVFVIVAGKIVFTKNSAVEEPLKALDTYLQGMKEQDLKKVYQAVSNSVYFTVYDPSSEDLSRFKKSITKQEEEIGTIQEWTFEPNPYYNEINNQAIITARLTTSKYKFVVEYDMRKFNHWVIYGTKIVSQVLLGKDGKNVHQKVYQ